MLPAVKQVHSKPLKRTWFSHATTARLRPSGSFRDVGKLLEDVGWKS